MSLDAHYALGSSIDASPSASAPYHSPIGDFTNQFTGSLNGGDFSISKLTVSISDAGVQRGGLFGFIGSGGEVYNLGLREVDIEVTSTDDDAYAGGLAGESQGTIYNCSVSGAVSGTTLGLNEPTYVGGLVGQNQDAGLIRNSYAAAVLRAEGDLSRIGGLVGENVSHSGTARIENAYAAGEVSAENVNAILNMGGLLGTNNGVALEQGGSTIPMPTALWALVRGLAAALVVLADWRETMSLIREKSRLPIGIRRGHWPGRWAVATATVLAGAGLQRRKCRMAVLPLLWGLPSSKGLASIPSSTSANLAVQGAVPSTAALSWWWAKIS